MSISVGAIGTGLGGAAGAYFGGPAGASAGAQIGGAFGSAFDSSPSVSNPSASDRLHDMDVLYPGTTPWERVGASGAASVNSSGAQVASAKLASDTAIKVANIHANAEMAKSGVNATTTSRGQDITQDLGKTNLSQQASLIKSQVSNLSSQEALNYQHSAESFSRESAQLLNNEQIPYDTRMKQLSTKWAEFRSTAERFQIQFASDTSVGMFNLPSFLMNLLGANPDSSGGRSDSSEPSGSHSGNRDTWKLKTGVKSSRSGDSASTSVSKGATALLRFLTGGYRSYGSNPSPSVH